MWLRDRITKLLYSEGVESIDEKELITEFCVLFYSTNRTAKEIINQLINNREIYRLKGKLYDKRSYEAEKIINKANGTPITVETQEKIAEND